MKQIEPNQVNITSFTSIKFNYSNYVLFVGSAMLDKGSYLYTSGWNPNPWIGVSTYTSGTAITLSGNYYAKMLIARLKTGNATINARGPVEERIAGVSGGTITGYISGASNISLTVTNTDYVVVLSDSNGTDNAYITITDT